MKRTRGVWLLVCLCVGWLAAMPAAAQDLSLYSLPHLFALPTATTARLYGMGGFVTCIPDDGFANPAFAALVTTPQAVGRYAWTDLDSGLTLRAWQLSASTGLGAGEGMQITGLQLDSSPGTLVTPQGPVSHAISEEDLALHYGRRLNDQWVVGLGTSPIFRTSTELRHPLSDDLLARLTSEGRFGFRLGSAYELPQGGWAGLVYDSYQERVWGEGPLFGAPVSATYDSQALLVGVAQPVHERVLAALEWQRLSSRGQGGKREDDGWRLGVEVLATPELLVRLGSNDGSFSWGAGWAGPQWTVNYAYARNLNDDLVGETLGGSHTHQIEASFRW